MPVVRESLPRPAVTLAPFDADFHSLRVAGVRFTKLAAVPTLDLPPARRMAGLGIAIVTGPSIVPSVSSRRAGSTSVSLEVSFPSAHAVAPRRPGLPVFRTIPLRRSSDRVTRAIEFALAVFSAFASPSAYIIFWRRRHPRFIRHRTLRGGVSETLGCSRDLAGISRFAGSAPGIFALRSFHPASRARHAFRHPRTHLPLGFADRPRVVWLALFRAMRNGRRRCPGFWASSPRASFALKFHRPRHGFGIPGRSNSAANTAVGFISSFRHGATRIASRVAKGGGSVNLFALSDCRPPVSASRAYPPMGLLPAVRDVVRTTGDIASVEHALRRIEGPTPGRSDGVSSSDRPSCMRFSRRFRRVR